jgi:hypothetical protein
VLYGGGTAAAPASSSSLFWDSVNSRLGVGTNGPSTGLHVTGQILGGFPVHLSLYGTPSYYNSAGTLANPIVLSTYYYLLWPSSGLTSKNWTPSYTTTMRLGIPYNGLYSIKFTYQTGTATTPSYEIFISKNLGNGTDLNPGDDRLLACAVVSNHITITATAYLVTTDFINFGLFVGSGSGFTGSTAGARCTVNATLLQRTS